jgi:hypothetical protein
MLRAFKVYPNHPAEHRPRQCYREAFWRAHREAWKRSDLNQRQYCEAQGIALTSTEPSGLRGDRAEPCQHRVS